MSTPIKKKVRQAWGWGEDGDKPNPFKKAAEDLVTDAKETASDIVNEPSEVPYRLKERIKRYLPWRPPSTRK